MRYVLPLLLLFAVRANAAEVWVLQGLAVGPSVPCALITWTGMMSFYNTGSTDATVRLLGVSGSGGIGSAPRELVVPPRRLTQTFDWNVGQAPLWVLHLDVPEGVLIESRINVGEQPQCPPFFPFDFSAMRGKIALPARTSLRPANEPQVHLGTDLGTINSRNNITIYNGGNEPAVGRIEIRRGCDDAVIDSRDVTIAANDVVQVTNLQGTSTCGPVNNAPYLAYAIVTVDRPSVSWVSSISNDHPPNVVYAVD